ncbi:hypothetical protein JHK82_034006 [Glycine max]|nr:hypothetical protein JHK82_034006 [Glycine max]
MSYDCKTCDYVFRAKHNAYVIYYCLPAESVSDLYVMGAPKQKWTAEEEQALKAGVVKHGVDKWRNLSVMANGWSSREKSRLSVRRVHQVPRQDENSMAITAVAPSDEEIVDVKPLQVLEIWCIFLVQRAGNSFWLTSVRVIDLIAGILDKLIMEAITCLKENGGSNKTAIAAFIEHANWTYDREQVRLQRDCDLPCVIEGLLCHSDPGDCFSGSGSQLLHCCALSPIFYLIFFISSLLVGLLGFCFSFCDGYSSSWTFAVLAALEHFSSSASVLSQFTLFFSEQICPCA